MKIPEKFIILTSIVFMSLHFIYLGANYIYLSSFPRDYPDDIYTILQNNDEWECEYFYGNICVYNNENLTISYRSGDAFYLKSNEIDQDFSGFGYYYSRNEINFFPRSVLFMSFELDYYRFDILGRVTGDDGLRKLTYNNKSLLRQMKRIIDNTLK